MNKMAPDLPHQNFEADNPPGAAPSARDTSTFYAVTVNYNTEDEIECLAESLAAVSAFKKLIIVDHSFSETLDTLKMNIPVQVVRQPNRGYGAGLNRGLREVPELDSVTLLCNPDITIMNPEAVIDLLMYMSEHPEVGCIVPALVNRRLGPARSCRKFYTPLTLLASRVPWWRTNPPRFLQEHFYAVSETDGPFDIDWGSGSAMFVRTALFPSQVAFDEDFFLYFEDVDLCTQMWLQGLAVRCFPALKCCHHERKQSHREFRYFMQHISSMFKYVAKYRGFPRKERLSSAQ